MFGRIIQKAEKSTTIFKDGKQFKLNFRSIHNPGDIITDNDQLLTPCKSTKPLKKLSESFDYYTKKMHFIEKIKNYMKSSGYREVLTKKLKRKTIEETNINLIKTDRGWLASSPEVEIKKLLCLGFDKLYELNYVYRDDQEDWQHSKEFLILEWYKTLAEPEEINRELLNLIIYLNGSGKLNYRGVNIDLSKLNYVKYDDLFIDHLSINIKDTSVEKLKKTFNIEGTDNLYDTLDAVFAIKIQNKLGRDHPTVVYDFPPERAALAKVEKGYAKRYEMYIAGIEISNCYKEETDVDALKKRITINDSEFLEAISFGMPPTSGIAVGMDRLFMILNNFKTIDFNPW